MARNIRTGQPRVGIRAPQGGGRVSSAVGSAVGGPRVSAVQYNPQFGARALAGALQNLSGTLDVVVNQEMRKEAKKAERVSSEAGARWGMVADIADLELPTGDSIGEEAFRRATIQAASANVELFAREEVDKLAQQFPGKPEQFKAALAERSQAILSGIDENLAAPAANAIGTLGQRYYAQLDEDRRTYLKDQTRATLAELKDTKIKSAAILARRGDIEGAFAEVQGLAETMADAGPVEGGGSGAFSLDDLADIQIKAKDKIRGDFLEGWVERTPNKRAALDGLRSGRTGNAAVDGVLAVSDPSLTDQMAGRLEADIRAQEVEARQEARLARMEAQTTARSVLEDELAAAEAGISAHPDYRRTVAAAFGDKAGPMIERVERVRRVSAVTREFSTMAPDEIAAAIQAEAPAGEGFAGEARDTRAMIEAAQKVSERRAKDPAGEALSAFPNIREMVLSNDLKQVGVGLRESARVQTEIFGVAPDKVQPLPTALVSNTVEKFKNAPTVDDRLAILQSFTTSLGDDDMARRVLTQMEDKGLPPDARFALERAGDGDLAGAREILGGLVTDPKDLPKLAETKTAEIATAVDSLMANPSTSAGLAAYRANLARQPGLFQRSAGEREALMRLATQYTASGDDPATAATKAEKALHGGAKVSGNEDIGYVRVPETVDVGEFTDALTIARSRIDLSRYAPTATPLRPGQEATGAQLQQQDFANRDYQRWADNIRSSGLWSDVEGGYALLEPTSGRQVGFMTLEQVQAAAADEMRRRDAAAKAAGDAGLISPGLVGNDDLGGGAGNDRLQDMVNATGGGLNPQLDVLLKRLVGGRAAPAYDPPGLTAEDAQALGIPTTEERQPTPGDS